MSTPYPDSWKAVVGPALCVAPIAQAPTVYLGGPITGATYQEATGWRQDIAAALEAYGFRCLSPMRRYKHTNEYYKNGKPIPRLKDDMPDSTEAMEGDLADIREADYVLINFLDSTYPSIGSLVELGYAAALKKKIVAALEPDDPHDHIFVTGLSLVTTSLDGAIAAIVMADRQQQGDY